ncbi:T9SS type A sorting domain-containing protein [Neolewinella agarilytica]|uniref:Por secretion system C-terminal sorting domain-containing protein n=1 Tax=Neolewinella agarilytica TaxID=478744 RepID=A0A1H8ZKQ8_9BACT|nr:T9SS type A sorting domain-containing protein [Neolewinella agarilytica]SEP64944.1 Por secretion system C-terminal sorting domain-containing protein [Neolewinella agarilytica]
MKQLYLFFCCCLLSTVLLAQTVTFDTNTGNAGYSAYPPADGVIGLEDYSMDLSAFPGTSATSVEITSILFVGGVSSTDGTGGVITVEFFDAATALVTSVDVNLSQDGNFAWTLTLTPPVTVPVNGFMQVLIDPANTNNSGRNVQGQWFLADPPITGQIGTTPGAPFNNGSTDVAFAMGLTVNDISLPVTFSNLSLTAADKSLQLDWSTSFEDNNRGFTVERSVDGSSFIDVGFVAGHDNASNGGDYRFLDQGIIENTTYFYRLRQEDYDGSTSYSDVVSGALASGTGFNVGNFVPNPARESTMLSIRLDEAAEVSLRLFDASGRQVAERKQQLGAGNNLLTLPLADLPAGTYLAQIVTADKALTQRLIIR